MKTQRDAALLGPTGQVKIARHDLAAPDADRRQESHFLPGGFRDRHDVAAAEGDRGCKAGEKQYNPGNFFSVGAIGLRIEESPNTSRCWSS